MLRLGDVPLLQVEASSGVAQCFMQTEPLCCLSFGSAEAGPGPAGHTAWDGTKSSSPCSSISKAKCGLAGRVGRPTELSQQAQWASLCLEGV